MAGHDHWVIAAAIALALAAAKLGFRVTSKMDKLELQEE
jgi:cysteine synthase